MKGPLKRPVITANDGTANHRIALHFNNQQSYFIVYQKRPQKNPAIFHSGLTLFAAEYAVVVIGLVLTPAACLFLLIVRDHFFLSLLQASNRLPATGTKIFSW